MTIFQFKWGKSRLYDWCVESVSDYCTIHGLVHKILENPILKIAPNPKTSGRSKEATAKYGGFLPIFEKENGFLYLENGPVLILDADIWIRPGAPNIFDELGEADFAGVRERDMPSLPKHVKKVRGYSRSMFTPLADVDWEWDDRGADFWNMGVMLCGNRFESYLNGETPREFLSRQEFQRFIDGRGRWKNSTDQVLLNWWSRKCGMERKNLSWKWNCLYSAVDQESVKKAHFVHFFLKDHLPNKGEDTHTLSKHVV